MVWGQISTFIKGDLDCHSYPGFYLPEKVYLRTQNEKKSILAQEEKKKVYEIFLAYEKWKLIRKAYDFNDIVNYILNEIKYFRYKGQTIHFLFIDEVQDLNRATLLLLTKLTELTVFMAGDTA